MVDEVFTVDAIVVEHAKAIVLGYAQVSAATRSTDRSSQYVEATQLQAVGIAANLDDERQARFVRGPLHGIPILLKDRSPPTTSCKRPPDSVQENGAERHGT